MANRVSNVTRYERGTNYLLDAVYEDADGPVWIVDGAAGRMPFLAVDEKDAEAQYMAKPYTSLYGRD